MMGLKASPPWVGKDLDDQTEAHESDRQPLERLAFAQTHVIKHQGIEHCSRTISHNQDKPWSRGTKHAKEFASHPLKKSQLKFYFLLVTVKIIDESVTDSVRQFFDALTHRKNRRGLIKRF
jgi:hypothetical protein